MAISLRQFRLFSVEPESGVHTADCCLLRLALHRHSEVLRSTGLHRHPHHQVLVYLRGGGGVRINQVTYEISAGTILLLPAKCEHQFMRYSRRNPLCLVIDFLHNEKLPLRIEHQGNARTSLLRKLINDVSYLKRAINLPEKMQRDGLALQLLGTCLDGLLQQGESPAKHPVSLLYRMKMLLQNSKNAHLTLDEAAAASGYQKDYLNRILKQQSGMSFGQLRAGVRLQHVENVMSRSASVAEAASLSGFDDVNYFVRWFRKQTGQTPGKVLRERRRIGYGN